VYTRRQIREASFFSNAKIDPEEYEARKGWGHSTWLGAIRVDQEANVKRLILFHQDLSHTNTFLEAFVNQARPHFPNTDAAREGWGNRM
jgi:ribonuclease BN (tRNA processing enzyme)